MYTLVENFKAKLQGTEVSIYEPQIISPAKAQTETGIITEYLVAKDGLSMCKP